MLLDSASLYFRAFHGVPESVTAPDGTPVNAVRGFLDMVAFLVRGRRPDRLVACLDLDWRPAFRVAAVPSYKAHRVSPKGGETVPDGLVPQVPVILEVLAALGIAAVGADGFEADDVIGTLAHAATEPVEVVSGDRDLFQVVRDDPPVHVLYVGKGVRKLEVMGEAEVAAKYGVPGRGYADFAVLRGDPSDGLPGVKGVGEKSAAALVSRFGSLDAMVAALDAGTDSASRPAPGPSWPRRATTWPRRRRWPGCAPTRRCRTTTRAAGRAGRPGPAGRAGRAVEPRRAAQPAAVGAAEEAGRIGRVRTRSAARCSRRRRRRRSPGSSPASGPGCRR